MKNMKLLKAAAASVLLTCSASAAFAGPAITGDAAVYGGWLSLYNDADGYDFNDGSVYGVNARARTGVLQLDLNYESVNAGYGDEYDTMGAALHLATSGETAVGLMAGIGTDNSDGSVTVGGEPYTTIALEAATMLGYSRLDAQAGYFMPADTDYIDSGYYAYLGMTTPLTEKLSLNLNVAGTRMAEEGTSDYSYLKAISYGAQLEYQTDTNLIAFVGVNGNHTAEPSEDEKWSTVAVMMGLRIPFGSGEDELVFADHNPLTGVNHLRLNDWE